MLEKRADPLRRAAESEDYPIYFGNIESVGWRAGDKKAVPQYLRHDEDGSLILDEQNEPILDADFNIVFEEFLQSPAAMRADWMTGDVGHSPVQSDSVPMSEVLNDNLMIIDPKRYSSKFRELQSEIRSIDHFQIGEVIEAVSERNAKPVASSVYNYVEIGNVRAGEYDSVKLRGWELPSRARLSAQRGDLFIPHVWGCAGKWFIAAGDCDNLIVTTGCSRFRVKEGKSHLLADLVTGLSSEAFSVQMRALATGSDGLADVSSDDITSIVLPRLQDEELRRQVNEYLDVAMRGDDRMSQFLSKAIKAQNFPTPEPRKSHCSLV